MQLRRQGSSVSPLRELYGADGGRLILPLDVCLVLDGGGVETLQFPATPGLLLDDSVVDSGGGQVGTVAAYDWPPDDDFDVKPLTFVASDGAANVPLGSAEPVELRLNDVVELETVDDNTLESVGSGVLGTVQSLEVLRVWPDLTRRVHTDRVDFGQNLLSTTRGARVVLKDGGALVGMLLFTQNQPDGTCNAFVYPAHLV
jgi:hypothetical protein